MYSGTVHHQHVGKAGKTDQERKGGTLDGAQVHDREKQIRARR